MRLDVRLGVGVDDDDTPQSRRRSEGGARAPTTTIGSQGDRPRSPPGRAPASPADPELRQATRAAAAPRRPPPAPSRAAAPTPPPAPSHRAAAPPRTAAAAAVAPASRPPAARVRERGPNPPHRRARRGRTRRPRDGSPPAAAAARARPCERAWATALCTPPPAAAAPRPAPPPPAIPSTRFAPAVARSRTGADPFTIPGRRTSAGRRRRDDPVGGGRKEEPPPFAGVAPGGPSGQLDDVAGGANGDRRDHLAHLHPRRWLDAALEHPAAHPPPLQRHADDRPDLDEPVEGRGQHVVEGAVDAGDVRQDTDGVALPAAGGAFRSGAPRYRPSARRSVVHPRGRLPGELLVGAPEVAVGGGPPVDRPAQVEVADDRRRPQVEQLVDGRRDPRRGRPSRCRRSRPSARPGGRRRSRRRPGSRSAAPRPRRRRAWRPSGRRRRPSGRPWSGPCRRTPRRRGGRRRRRCRR